MPTAFVQQVGVAWADVAAAGLGTPGPMSLAEGCLLDPSNLPAWHNFHAQQALEKAVGNQSSFINDANAAALGLDWGRFGAIRVWRCSRSVPVSGEELNCPRAG